MGNKRSFSGKELIKILQKLGFEIIRTRGSHNFLRYADGRTTEIPLHSNESISKGLLSKVLRDTELTYDDLIK